MVINKCPNCGCSNPKVRFEVSYGHGDSGYSNLRVQCPECSLSFGEKSYYGIPSEDDKLETIINWNNLKQ